jgi:hypothetical protein
MLELPQSIRVIAVERRFAIPPIVQSFFKSWTAFSTARMTCWVPEATRTLRRRREGVCANRGHARYL